MPGKASSQVGRGADRLVAVPALPLVLWDQTVRAKPDCDALRYLRLRVEAILSVPIGEGIGKRTILISGPNQYDWYESHALWTIG